MFEACELVKFASDAAFAIDAERKIVAWNRGAQLLLGYAPEEVIGQQCADYLQAVTEGGQPLCVPGCEAVRCFRLAQPFAAELVQARHKNGDWVSLGISSIVTSPIDSAAKNNSVVAIIFLRGQARHAGVEVHDQRLQVFAFGPFGVAAGGSSLAVEKWRRKQAVSLLKFLVAHLGHAVRQETLIDHIWPDTDEDHGRERLKVTVYYLRRKLRDANIDEATLETVGRSYVLRREKVWVDAEAFERCIDRGLLLQEEQRLDEALQCFEEAIRLYRGDYMEEDIYADWCAAERERLREIQLDGLSRMEDCYAKKGHFAKAAQVCRTALVFDACRENFHHALMENLYRLGRVDQAAAQYKRCKAVLARELGVEPMPKIQEAYQRILNAAAKTAGRR